MPGRIFHLAWWQKGGWRLPAMVIFAALVLTNGIVARTRDASRYQEQTCRRVNALEFAIDDILGRSLKVLPANGYYKQHPDELAAAVSSTRAALAEIRAARCQP